MNAPLRPHRRDDGWPTRSDIRYDTDAERLCRILLQLVEGMGASTALTQAVTSISDAREAIADHVEDVPYDSRVWSVNGGRVTLNALEVANAEIERLSDRAFALEAELAEARARVTAAEAAHREQHPTCTLVVDGRVQPGPICGVGVALAAASPPEEPKPPLPRDWYVRTGRNDEGHAFAYCFAKGPHRAHCILPERHGGDHEWAWFTREERAAAEAVATSPTEETRPKRQAPVDSERYGGQLSPMAPVPPPEGQR